MINKSKVYSPDWKVSFGSAGYTWMLVAGEIVWEIASDRHGFFHFRETADEFLELFSEGVQEDLKEGYPSLREAQAMARILTDMLEHQRNAS